MIFNGQRQTQTFFKLHKVTTLTEKIFKSYFLEASQKQEPVKRSCTQLIFQSYLIQKFQENFLKLIGLSLTFQKHKNDVGDDNRLFSIPLDMMHTFIVCFFINDKYISLQYDSHYGALHLPIEYTKSFLTQKAKQPISIICALLDTVFHECSIDFLKCQKA